MSLSSGNTVLLIPVTVYRALELEESLQSGLEVIAAYTEKTPEVILGLLRA